MCGRQGLRDQLGNVADAQALLNPLGLYTIFKHLHTKGATGRNDIGTRFDGLLGADVIDPSPNVHFHKGMPATGAAA